MSKHSPKEYWKYLNSINKSKNKEKPSINTLFHFFKDLNHDTDTGDFDLNEHISAEINLQDDDPCLNAPITQKEISKCIKKLKNSKTPGIDEILNEHIKYTLQQMLPIYTNLFNIILQTGIIPEQWVQGMIKPIYKNKGDPLNPENYRPITLLSCLGKLFTSIINERLNLFLNENNILLENQAGFRKNYSTNDHIFVLYSLIEILKQRKKKLYCAFIDFSKAFDSVWRIGLWKKML